jgi:hypothetical protein
VQRRRAAAYHAVMNLADRELPSPLYVSAFVVCLVCCFQPHVSQGKRRGTILRATVGHGHATRYASMCHYYEVPSFYGPYRIWYFIFKKKSR